jgi:hypothetical protein
VIPDRYGSPMAITSSSVNDVRAVFRELDGRQRSALLSGLHGEDARRRPPAVDALEGAGGLLLLLVSLELLTDNGVELVTRIAGLLLAAIAIQLVANSAIAFAHTA